MKTVDIADELFREIDDDTLNIPTIYYWLISNVGQLNTLLNLDLVIANDEFDPELTTEEAGILKHLYLLSFYRKQVKQNLGAAAFGFSEVSDGDSTIRWMSRNDVARGFQQILNMTQQNLDNLVFLYKQNKALPVCYGAYQDGLIYNRINLN